MRVEKANHSSIIPYGTQYMLKTAVMMDKMVRPSDVDSSISCSPLVNASLGPVLVVAYTVPYCPSHDCFLELFFPCFRNFTFYNKRINTFWWTPGFTSLPTLLGPAWWCRPFLPLFVQVVGLRVILSSLNECAT